MIIFKSVFDLSFNFCVNFLFHVKVIPNFKLKNIVTFAVSSAHETQSAGSIDVRIRFVFFFELNSLVSDEKYFMFSSFVFQQNETNYKFID